MFSDNNHAYEQLHLHNIQYIQNKEKKKNAMLCERQAAAIIKHTVNTSINI